MFKMFSIVDNEIISFLSSSVKQVSVVASTITADSDSR